MKSLQKTFEGKAVAQATDAGPLNPRKNLMLRRSALYAPQFQYRYDQQVLKDTDMFDAGRTVHDLETRLEVEELEGLAKKEEQVRRYIEVVDDLSEWYESLQQKRARWDVKRAYRRELDLVVGGALRLIVKDTGPRKRVDRRKVFCLGDGTFRTGIGLASPHETFKAHFLRKTGPL
ncbi:hypothetical protein BGZ67_009609 [Mortierella alpina]|nr:hypothetical protein BGZ67_009609 [Mortierella alpina]